MTLVKIHYNYFDPLKLAEFDIKGQENRVFIFSLFVTP